MRAISEIHLATWLREARLSGSSEAVRRGWVALTFDDGPHPIHTPKVLRILKAHDCQATFFWIGSHAQQLANKDGALFQNIVEGIKEGNHEIGLHDPTDYVPTIETRLYGKFSKEEIRVAKQMLEDLTGISVRYYRPHRIHLGPEVLYARELGLITVFFDRFHYARAEEAQDLQVRRFSGAKPGSILLFHDGVSIERQNTHIANVLPIILNNLRRKGLHPTSVSNIL